MSNQNKVSIPKIYRASSLSSCVVEDIIEDLYFDITSFDDSCIQNSHEESRVKNFDTSSDISVEYESYTSKSSPVSFDHECADNVDNKITLKVPDMSRKPKKHHYKSLLAMIKILKNLKRPLSIFSLSPFKMSRHP